MRAVVTRVSSASVEVSGTIIGAIDEPGLLALIGITHTDSEEEAALIARKIWDLRILDGERSASDVSAPILVVSQFTLYADVRRGRRPSWSAASGREHAEPLVEKVVELLRQRGARVETGTFGAMMRVSSVNEGPFTIWLDTADLT